MINSQFSGRTGPPMTWGDVARALGALDPISDEWKSRPNELVRIQIDWAGATFQIKSGVGAESRVKEWLKNIVPGLLTESGNDAFILDGPVGLSRLPIEFDEVDATQTRFRPSLGAIEGDFSFLNPEPDQTRTKRPVPVVACHSVKGGTGRTTSAIALASIWQRREQKPILIVDADIEAPGLSYLFQETQIETTISFEDLIMLVHASTEDMTVAVIEWVANRLAAQRLGQLVILPLRRALDELASSAIRSEHLASEHNPYALADLLSQTAQAAGCAGVVVDLRAGLVPVATQLMLDPDVLRVFCTSLSNQSVRATGALFSFIARELRKSAIELTAPLIIVNKIPSVFRDFGTDDRILEPVLELVESSLIPDEAAIVESSEVLLGKDLQLKPFTLVKITEISDLQVPRSRWDDFAVQLETSGFVGQIRIAVNEWLDRVLPTITQPQTNAIVMDNAMSTTASERRGKLSVFAEAMEFAETKSAVIETPLITGPFRAFGKEAQNPIVVSEGAKGTGKTLTARYFINKATWKNALASLGYNNAPFDAEIVPAVNSMIGSSAYVTEVDERRKAASMTFGFGAPQRAFETKRFLVSQVAIQHTQSQWTDLWLDVLAWTVGFKSNHSGAGDMLITELRKSGDRMIAVIEGIEEIRPTTPNNSLPAMIGSLLVDLPARLRTEQGRPVGIVVFARRDTVEVGIPQNVGQFRRQFQDFALTWNESDVLELAAWLASKSKALDIWDSKFRDRPRIEQEQLLEQLWGRKLGPDDRDGRRTQEAYTANWVLAVLSDLRGRLTARDLVRLIKEACSVAVTSQDEGLYPTRLLSPSALRRAVGPTSAEKVKEIQEEVPELQPIFAKIKQSSNVIKAPISQEKVQEMNISEDDLRLLQTHGVILDESPPYEVPELFRIGLGLTHGGARRNVIGILRRAKERGNLRGI